MQKQKNAYFPKLCNEGQSVTTLACRNALMVEAGVAFTATNTA